MCFFIVSVNLVWRHVSIKHIYSQVFFCVCVCVCVRFTHLLFRRKVKPIHLSFNFLFILLYRSHTHTHTYVFTHTCSVLWWDRTSAHRDTHTQRARLLKGQARAHAAASPSIRTTRTRLVNNKKTVASSAKSDRYLHLAKKSSLHWI